MGCGAGGTNHIRKGEYGAKGAHPLCGEGQLGYMWSPEEFKRMEEEGRACRACQIAIERDELADRLETLAHNV